MSVFLSARGEAALVVSNGNSHFGSHISIPSIFYLRLQSQTFLPLQNATALASNHHPEELPLHSTQNRGDFEMLQDSLLWLWKRRLQIPSCCSRVFAFGLTYFTLQPTWRPATLFRGWMVLQTACRKALYCWIRSLDTCLYLQDLVLLLIILK